MKQGEIWHANLDPSKGSEPVVILSGNLLNQHLPIVIAPPLTTKIKKYKGNPILGPTKVNGLKHESELLVFHLRSIPKERLTRKCGNIEPSDLALAVKTLNDILKY